MKRPTSLRNNENPSSASTERDNALARWEIPLCSPANPGPRPLPRPGVVEAPRAWARRLQTWKRQRGQWIETALGTHADAVSALPFPGSRHATIQLDGVPLPISVAPCKVPNPLDPPEAILVADHPLTKPFVAQLRRKTRTKVELAGSNSRGSDIWVQDSLEVLHARGEYPSAPSTTVGLTGLRRKHDMGLDCAALDRGAPAALLRAKPGAVFLSPGKSLPGRRWIDWYGNLESTPALPGFPNGRILTGKQVGLEMHPDVLDFLKDQEAQWPPIVVDVGMLTIGHVDEMVTFVPAPTPSGWTCLVLSPRLGRRILSDCVGGGGADLPALANKRGSTTARGLLAKLGSDERVLNDEANAEASVEALVQELGVKETEVVRVPVLLRSGGCLLPNPVNGILLGKRYFAPDPLFEPFRASLREQFRRTSASLEWIDCYEPFHVRGGEIHCGTQVIRRPAATAKARD